MRSYCFALFISVLIVGCFNKPKKNIPIQEPTFKKEGTLYITRKTDTLLDGLSIEVANTPFERETGLMYRSKMDKNQGMFFVFDSELPRAFYMKNTLFSLDIIYLNKSLEIVEIIPNAEPMNELPLPSESPSQYVLELLGGQSNELGISKGDQISYYTP